MAVELYTDIWDLISAIKYNLRRQIVEDPYNKTFDNVKSWSLGYVFPETIHPTISIFPVRKNFLGKRSGGDEPVSYTVSIDVYAHKRLNPKDAKVFCFNALDEVKKAVKKSIQMIGKDGTAHSYSTAISAEDIFEPLEKDEDYYSSTAAVEIVCHGYHQMNQNRLYEPHIVEADYNTFFDKVVERVQDECLDQGLGFKSFISKVARGTTATPAIFILPRNEYILETLSNGYVIQARPITFHVLSKGYPKASVMKQNIKLTEQLVDAIEKHHMVGGLAQQFDMKSIDYGAFREAGYTFASSIQVEYRSRIKYNSVYK